MPAQGPRQRLPAEARSARWSAARCCCRASSRSCSPPRPRPRPAADPLAPRPPHFPAQGQRVIFIYLTGGVSHVDTFDPKPQASHHTSERQGQAPPAVALGRFPAARGRCGTEVSDLFPHVGECMDDLCLIRSMVSEHNDHAQATLGVHTGSVTFAGRASARGSATGWGR